MTMSVIRPSNIIKTYCLNYFFTILFFIAMLVTGNWGRDHSYIEAIIRWFLIIFIFCIFILMPVWNGKWGFAAMRFKINENGVAYIKRNTCYYLKWDEMEYIISVSYTHLILVMDDLFEMMFLATYSMTVQLLEDI